MTCPNCCKIQVKRVIEIPAINKTHDKSIVLSEAELLVEGPRTVIAAAGDPMVGLGIVPALSFIAVAVSDSSANPTEGGS